MVDKSSMCEVSLNIDNIVLFLAVKIVDLNSTCVLLDSLHTFEHIMSTHLTLQHHIMSCSNLIYITP